MSISIELAPLYYYIIIFSLFYATCRMPHTRDNAASSQLKFLAPNLRYHKGITRQNACMMPSLVILTAIRHFRFIKRPAQGTLAAELPRSISGIYIILIQEEKTAI